jgi:hypothetical protein
MLGQNLFHNFLNRVSGDLDVALWAENLPDFGEEKTKVIIDLGCRSNGRAGIFDGVLLFDGNGWRNAMDGFHVRPVHLFEKLPGIRREGLNVAPLTLCEEGVKGQGRFTGARNACDDRDLPSRDPAGDVFQVMRFCADDFDKLFHQNNYITRKRFSTILLANDLFRNILEHKRGSRARGFKKLSEDLILVFTTVRSTEKNGAGN